MTKYKQVEVDLDDFDMGDIVSHIEDNSYALSSDYIERLKYVVNDDDDEEYEESISLDNQRKLDIITKNLDKLTYLEICEMFEGKQPYQL